MERGYQRGDLAATARLGRFVSVLAALCILSAGVAAAQDIDQPGVLTAETEMFYHRDFRRTPMYVLAAGTPVQVLRKEGSFYHVVYRHPTYGGEAGYVPVANVHVLVDGEAHPTGAGGPQVVSQRGFLEMRAVAFPQPAANDVTRGMGDTLVRQELFLRPSRWLQLGAGVDVRANTEDQVEGDWQLDRDDRGVPRPPLAIRRLTLTINARHFSLDAGKQFIRWGRADILSPTDRFAPRDYVNLFDTEFLPVWAVRPSIQIGSESFEAVWSPRLTPSRLPLIGRRWTVIPPEAAGFTLRDSGSVFPERPEAGARWTHTGRFDAGLSLFDGFNHLPDIEAQPASADTIAITRSYPRIRTYGAELSIPTTWITLKGEGAYFTSPTSTSEEYVLYVIELERQVGEWLFDGGYAGDIVTESRPHPAFDAERGVARSFIGRAAYTVDPRRTVAVEGAARRSGKGVYVKGEYSQTFGQHWRLTLAGVGIEGEDDDYLGQFHRNSHGSAALRFSF